PGGISLPDHRLPSIRNGTLHCSNPLTMCGSALPSARRWPPGSSCAKTRVLEVVNSLHAGCPPSTRVLPRYVSELTTLRARAFAKGLPASERYKRWVHRLH